MDGVSPDPRSGGRAREAPGGGRRDDEAGGKARVADQDGMAQVATQQHDLSTAWVRATITFPYGATTRPRLVERIAEAGSVAGRGGTVKFRGSVADLADETRHAELPWVSISARDHQPRHLAVSPLRCEFSRCRRSPGSTWHHGVLRSDPTVVPHVRFGIRSPAQASTGSTGRHLAPGRGLRHYSGTATLSLACRRSRWRRHRYPRPVASRLPGCHTLFPQAVEGPRASAWAVGHRQAEQLQGCTPSGHAVRRSQYGPVREQSRRSFPPAHTATRATNATVQIFRAGATCRARPRPAASPVRAAPERRPAGPRPRAVPVRG